MDKLGQEFISIDPSEEVDIGDGYIPRPTFVNKNMKSKMIGLLKEYSDFFAWSYTKMPNFSRELVDHRLPIKTGFKPFKQKASPFHLDLIPRIKDEIHRF